MSRLIYLLMLGVTMTLTGFPALSEEPNEVDAIEEIIVTGERGETTTLDRSMTVTGFNGALIEKLGIQNIDDLEVLVPGLQKGVQSSAGKNEDGHLTMRGVANDRRVNFFQDTSVGVYVDGIENPMTYALSAGMFDVERVEVARGPQGTTGGKTALSGTLSFVSKKPTDEWDLKASAELTDQASQQLDIAFGGPIGDSAFSYRLAVNRLTGDGIIKNVGGGPDAGKPDRFQYAPQLRFKNDRWDITARYRNLEDTGVQRISLAIGARDSQEQYILNADGSRRCTLDRDPQSPTNGRCIEDSNGNIIYQINPNYGLGQSPAIVNCPGFNNDGTRDAGLPVVCEGKYLTLATEINAPIRENNTQETYSLEAKFALNDTHDITYFYGDGDTRTDVNSDQDMTARVGGGVCSAIHPRVISGELTAGQTHPRCALDGKGNGVYADKITNYLRTSKQISHEIKLVSNNDGPLNYTLGYMYMEGDSPYVYRDMFNGVDTGSDNLNNATFYTDTTAKCEAEHSGNNMLEVLNPESPMHFLSAAWFGGCYGSPHTAYHSDVTNGGTHVNGSGVKAAFYGNVEYEQAAYFGNVEYVLNDQMMLFAGIRFNDDHKEHNQNDFTSAGQTTLADGTVINTINGIFRSKFQQTVCCGYVGINRNADGTIIPDDRTFADSKVVTWKTPTWAVGFEYAPSDNMMYYGRISKGYRAGGFSGFGDKLGEAMVPEEMINYEAGLKGLFLDNAVQLEISAYYQDFEYFWIQARRLRTADELVIDNPSNSAWIGDTHSISGTTIGGIEAQGAWQINDRLILRGFYELMTSSFGDFTTNYCCTPTGTTAAASLQPLAGPDGQLIMDPATGEPRLFSVTGSSNFGGNSLRNQPENKFSATLTYDVPINPDWGTLDVLTIYSWRDSMYPDEANLDIYKIPDFTRWDVRSNWSSPTGTYSLSFWVTNVLDTVQVQTYSPRDGNGVTNAVQGTVTDERRIGLTFNYQL